ncbi:ArnT family glycosyltransferase [Paracraurococcus lichenis]|uniref:Glycosyltransferase family 39 protein n=1 Tax=Paracraurococcus lichenis TaxID=3064888 RepID=A0ABT9DVZ0_9PROT|nr:glycosyltransferase family 39 protein [Paracraurococcus sp. LOR1-02]MDO9708070.1 glycosyltransferase family 39 protein [Paracraurococcus sp. LOR1-02]
MSTTYLRSPEAGLLATPRPAASPALRLRALIEAAFVPLLMLGASLLFRSIGFTVTVIDTDEGLYLVQAREWLRGGWPLVAVWDMHPIGAPAVYAAAIGLFGDSIATIRMLGIACVALAAWALYGAVRAAGGVRPVAVAAGLLYIAHTVLLFGLASNTEVLFAPFVVATVALGLRAGVRALEGGAGPGWGELALMGLLMGCGFAIKPVVTPEGCLAFALLTFPALWRRVLPFRRFLGMAAAYAALVLTPTTLFALAYAAQGDLTEFLDGSFLAPLRYAEARLSLHDAAQRVQVAVMVLLWPLLLAGLTLARWGLRRGRGGRLARVAVLWFACGSLAIIGPGFFYPHYFLIWMPPMAILAAMGAWRLARFARPRRAMAAFVALVALVAAEAWRQEATVRIGRGTGIYGPDPVAEVAKAVKARLQPGEAIFVANYHPVIYALTDAALPTRFVFPEHLTGGFTQVSDIDTDAELRRVLAMKPRIVVVDRGWWWHLRPSAAAILTEVLGRDFELEATVAEERGPVELWRPKSS